jgi:hypothetical protein
MNEIRVEAEGHNSGGVLIAEKIKFKRARVRMVAVASSASTLDFATGDTVTIVINDLTDTSNATLPLAGPQRYEMEGFKDNAGNIIAEEIEDTNESRDILKAPVEAKAGDILTMISLSIDISNVPADEFKDENDNQITKAEFLSGATVGTVVKVRDNDPDGLWDRAELED